MSAIDSPVPLGIPYETSVGSSSHRYLLASIEPLLASLPPRAKVLDLGCGNGSLTAALAKPGWAMYGVDASQSGIRIAAETYSHIEFACLEIGAPVRQAFGNEAFDAIVCTEVIEHLYAPRTALKCAFDVLRPGGMLVVSTPYHGYVKNLVLALAARMDHHWQAWREGGHIKFWSRRTLSHLFREAGFTSLEFYGAGRCPYLWKSMVIRAYKP